MNVAVNSIPKQAPPKTESSSKAVSKDAMSFKKMMKSAEESASYEKKDAKKAEGENQAQDVVKPKEDLAADESLKSEETTLENPAEIVIMNGRLAANIVQLPTQNSQTAIVNEGKIGQMGNQQASLQEGMAAQLKSGGLEKQGTVVNLVQTEGETSTNLKTANSQNLEVAKQTNIAETGKQSAQPDGAKVATQTEQASQITTKGQEQGKSDTGGGQKGTESSAEQKTVNVSTNQKKSDTSENTLKTEMHIAPKTEALDMSKVNVKVSDGQVKADSPTFAKDVSEQILYKTQNGKTEFEIKLNPRDLGNITIKMSFEGGKASVLMECANPKAHNLLMGSLEQIKGIIEQQTGTLAKVTVNQDQQEQAKQSFEGKNENQQKDEQKQRQAESYKNTEYDEIDTAMFLAQMRLGLSEKGGTI